MTLQHHSLMSTHQPSHRILHGGRLSRNRPLAIRKGRTYGTLLGDLERRQPEELLQGTNLEELVTWLKAQTQLVALVRGRSGAYALARQTGAPDAFEMPTGSIW